jgi:hypothetical protein
MIPVRPWESLLPEFAAAYRDLGRVHAAVLRKAVGKASSRSQMAAPMTGRSARQTPVSAKAHRTPRFQTFLIPSPFCKETKAGISPSPYKPSAWRVYQPVALPQRRRARPWTPSNALWRSGGTGKRRQNEAVLLPLLADATSLREILARPARPPSGASPWHPNRPAGLALRTALNERSSPHA